MGKCPGDVPRHWDVTRVKQICRLAYGDALSTEFRVPGAVSAVGSNGPVGLHNSANTRGPCIVIGRKGSFGKVNYSVEPVFAIDTTFFIDSRQSSAHLRWLYYLLGWLQLDRVTRDSAIPGLARQEVYEMRAVVPPLPEQRAIARFLNHADRRIRRYIRAKERLIELLQEQKQAIIHQAVTGQIDVRAGQPYPAYKDSGVEWLGEVPKDWGVVQLGRIATDRCDGPFGSGLKSSHYTDEGVRVVRLQNIGHGEFRHGEPAFVSPEHYSTLGDHSVEVDDVLIAGLGDAKHPAGRACVAPGDIGLAMVKADCFRFRLDQSTALPRFVALQLTATARSASGLLSTGATRQRINLRSTAARRIAIPEIEEQSWIVEHITHEIASHVDAQENARRGIELLSEYRTRLIADVVTGKLDVREAAAGLPDSDPFATADTQDPTPESQAEPATVAQGPHP